MVELALDRFMISVMDSRKESLKRNPQKCLDSQLWHACAGGMVQMPPVNSKVFYFPQGHAEHAQGTVDFGTSQIPPLILCRLAAIKYMADPENDEVYAKITLMPMRSDEYHHLDDDGSLGKDGTENLEKVASFAKTLTQSDANNGGGFSVPRYCAETIFPRLDYSAEPPVQTIVAKDVHGESWKFRHIYRGTPRRHLLTTGWGNFVNQKKLVAGDSIVFLRAENGDLCVGIRRAKRGIGIGGNDNACGWNSASGNFGGYSMFAREEGSNLMQKGCGGEFRRKVTGESVLQAATLAAKGQPFEVVYYPRAGTPEFFVRASSVSTAMQVQWCSGMRFKMPFETEDASRISWFMGTISSVQVADPIHWPSSPWRILQVSWDEPDLLQNVKSVSPWLVELVSNMPSIHLSHFSPPRKKLRTPPNFPILDQIPVPPFPSNPLGPNSPLRFIPDNIPAGIQGARHAQFLRSSSDLRLNQLHSGLFPVGSHPLNHTSVSTRFSRGAFFGAPEDNNNSISCLLRMGTSENSSKENFEKKSPHILLFGQLILVDQQNSESSSGDTTGRCSSEGNQERMSNSSEGSRNNMLYYNGTVESSSDDGFTGIRRDRASDLDLGTGHCKVFMESENVGRTLDLSNLGSYDELYRNLRDMFGINGSERLSKVLYSDAAGAIKNAGDEPFSDFLKTAKRLTIPAGYAMKI